MFLVQRHIDKRQDEIREHPFFERLEQESDLFKGMRFIPKLAFWPLVFQDVLRMIPPRIQTKELRRIATHHKIEDAGHDKWFLNDLAKLAPDRHFDIAWLFSKECQHIREIIYSVVAEVFMCSSDIQHVVLLLALEPTGHVFFEHISKYVASRGYTSQLEYFSGNHLEVEKNHAIFEEELKKGLSSRTFTEEERAPMIAMIDRVYSAFHALFDELLDCFQTPSNEGEEEPYNEPTTLVA